jgi:hypothetical protein
MRALVVIFAVLAFRVAQLRMFADPNLMFSSGVSAP